MTTIVDDIAEARQARPDANVGGADFAAELSESLSTAANGVQALLQHADAAESALARRRALQEEILRRLPPLPQQGLFYPSAAAPDIPLQLPAPAPAAEAAEKYSDIVMRRFKEGLFVSPQPASKQDIDSVPNGNTSRAPDLSCDNHDGNGTSCDRGSALEETQGTYTERAAPVSKEAGLGNGWGGLPVADPAQVFASFFVLQQPAARSGPSATAGNNAGEHTVGKC